MDVQPGEEILSQVHATLDGFNNKGELYLTTRRLVWTAKGLRLPLTAIFGERHVDLDLRQIVRCYDVGNYFWAFVLSVETGSRRYVFHLKRWWWSAWMFSPGLTRYWARAINQAREMALAESR